MSVELKESLVQTEYVRITNDFCIDVINQGFRLKGNHANMGESPLTQ